ncbi:sugar ABC transporter substrate-binding protein [Kribbella solani]|uniref:Simple sugar transport system substrate-binding protein n=1 Tax=Kribbella solani TaxID=236067 RepID=A0A841DTA9_9ACTN|nr:sugar ABC transporter substrate-binding protein [Kribbella solani]MBB5979950.1 simple sugar transport system substrate-binding protein [Kribbella solani]MDX2968125.1 sugar ABC transporter substrate-binding protein [Kribbella solani]
MRKVIAALLGPVLATAVLAGCSKEQAGTEGTAVSSGKKVHIIMVTHGAPGDPFWNAVKRGAEDAAKDFKVEFDYQSTSKVDPAEQARLIEAAIARKPDGLAVSILDPDAVAGPIKKAVARGIPVISLNSGDAFFAKLGILAHVGQAEEIAGRQAGERMAGEGVKNAICINHGQGDKSAELRCQGFTGAISKAGGKAKQVVVSQGDPTGTQRRIEAALKADPGIDGVLGLGPVIFNPVKAALSSTGKLGKLRFATFDLSPDILAAVRDGQADFAIDQQQYLQGYLPVEFLAQRLRLGICPTGLVLAGPNFVTKADAQAAIELSKQGLR